jgi:hypothetical protein
MRLALAIVLAGGLLQDATTQPTGFRAEAYAVPIEISVYKGRVWCRGRDPETGVARGPKEAQGPDLAVIVLSPAVASSLEAKKSFFPPQGERLSSFSTSRALVAGDRRRGRRWVRCLRSPGRPRSSPSAQEIRRDEVAAAFGRCRFGARTASSRMTRQSFRALSSISINSPRLNRSAPSEGTAGVDLTLVRSLAWK